jgi:hypothetical protein
MAWRNILCFGNMLKMLSYCDGNAGDCYTYFLHDMLQTVGSYA